MTNAISTKYVSKTVTQVTYVYNVNFFTIYAIIENLIAPTFKSGKLASIRKSGFSHNLKD